MQSENSIKKILHCCRHDSNHHHPDEMHQRKKTTENQSGFEFVKHGVYNKKIKKLYFFINVRIANTTIPAPNPINNPATRLSKRKPHPIPRSNPAGMNNADLFSCDFFSLCFVVIDLTTKIKVILYVAIFMPLTSCFRQKNLAFTEEKRTHISVETHIFFWRL